MICIVIFELSSTSCPTHLVFVLEFPLNGQSCWYLGLYCIQLQYTIVLISLSRSVSVCVYLFSTLDVCIYHLLCINLIKLLLSIRKFIGLIIFIAFWVSFVAVNAEDVLYIASSKKRLSSRFGAVHTRSYVLMRNMTVAREQLAQCTCTCTDS